MGCSWVFRKRVFPGRRLADRHGWGSAENAGKNPPMAVIPPRRQADGPPETALPFGRLEPARSQTLRTRGFTPLHHAFPGANVQCILHPKCDMARKLKNLRLHHHSPEETYRQHPRPECLAHLRRLGNAVLCTRARPPIGKPHRTYFAGEANPDSTRTPHRTPQRGVPTSRTAARPAGCIKATWREFSFPPRARNYFSSTSGLGENDQTVVATGGDVFDVG